jgi:hypothetical protein
LQNNALQMMNEKIKPEEQKNLINDFNNYFKKNGLEGFYQIKSNGLRDENLEGFPEKDNNMIIA